MTRRSRSGSPAPGGRAGPRAPSPAPKKGKASSSTNGHPFVAKVVDGFEPDMYEPLVHQVKYMDRDEYIKWVHTAFKYPEAGKTARFFKSSFLEFFSRTPWWVVPLIWIPVSAAMVTLNYDGASPQRLALLYVTGLVIWTIIEYSLHRFLFHVDDFLPNNGLMITAHFLLHGVHHRIYMDRHRLVMPPALAFPLALLVHGIWRGLCMPNATNETYFTMFAGTVLGYICYDCIHYHTHHGWNPAKGSYLYDMRKYHMKHHTLSDGYRQGFGITSTFWDRVGGTLLDVNRTE